MFCLILSTACAWLASRRSPKVSVVVRPPLYPQLLEDTPPGFPPRTGQKAISSPRLSVTPICLWLPVWTAEPRGPQKVSGMGRRNLRLNFLPENPRLAFRVWHGHRRWDMDLWSRQSKSEPDDSHTERRDTHSPCSEPRVVVTGRATQCQLQLFCLSPPRRIGSLSARRLSGWRRNLFYCSCSAPL